MSRAAAWLPPVASASGCRGPPPASAGPATTQSAPSGLVPGARSAWTGVRLAASVACGVQQRWSRRRGRGTSGACRWAGAGAAASAAGEERQPPRSLFELLGFRPGEELPRELVRKRQRALLRVCHPDVAGPGGAAVTAIIAQADEVLGGDKSRGAYDEQLRTGRPGSKESQRKWVNLQQVQFSEDRRAFVPPEDRGLHYASGESMVVDEVACIGCRLCTELAENTFEMVTLPHDDTRGGYTVARVRRQWGDGEVALEDSRTCCPSGCIHWLPQASARTVEYVIQAEEYEPYNGARRKNNRFRGNFDPLTGKQVWWPVEEALQMYKSGVTCPSAGWTTGPATRCLGEGDLQLAAAWAELPPEVQRRALSVVSDAAGKWASEAGRSGPW